MTAAAVGFERVECAWWLDIAQQLIDAAVQWVESAALMDLRFWQGQVRIKRRAKLPSRRELAKRWGWTQHRVRMLLKGEGWHDPHHTPPQKTEQEQDTQPSPRTRPHLAQTSPGFEPIAGVEPHRAAQPSPTARPDVATRANYTEHRTQNTDLKTHRPAEVALVAGPEDTAEETPQVAAAPAPKDAASLPLAAVSGTGRGLIWGDLVRHLEAAGYQTLGQLAEAGRDGVADALGRNASARRLDRIAACLAARGLTTAGWVASGPDSRAGLTGRPADRFSLDRQTSGPLRRDLSGFTPYRFRRTY